MITTDEADLDYAGSDIIDDANYVDNRDDDVYIDEEVTDFGSEEDDYATDAEEDESDMESEEGAEDSDEFKDEDDDTEDTTEDEEDAKEDNEDTEEDSEEGEETEPEYEDVEVPDFIPDDLIPPEDFKTEQEELQWYREHYADIANVQNTPEFKEKFLGAYKEYLAEAEDKVLEYKALEEAFEKGNPELLAKIHFPQFLANNGATHKLTEAEAKDFIKEKLSEEFGSNYVDVFNESDLLDPTSVSSKMLARQNELLIKINEHNAMEFEPEQKEPDVQQPSVEEIAERLSGQYDEYFAEVGYTEDEFGEFVKELSSWNYTLADLHRAFYFDEYIKEAVEHGKREAAKSIARTVGTPVETGQQEQKKSRNSLEDDAEAYFSNGAKIARGGLPY